MFSYATESGERKTEYDFTDDYKVVSRHLLRWRRRSLGAVCVTGGANELINWSIRSIYRVRVCFKKFLLSR